jgi:hypothetical protein
MLKSLEDMGSGEEDRWRIDGGLNTYHRQGIRLECAGSRSGFVNECRGGVGRRLSVIGEGRLIQMCGVYAYVFK